MGIVLYHKNIMWQQKGLLERLMVWHNWKYKKYPMCFPKIFPDAKWQELWIILDSWKRGLPFALWWLHLHSLLAGCISRAKVIPLVCCQILSAVGSFQLWRGGRVKSGKEHSWELGVQVALVEDKNETFCRCQRGAIQGWCATLQVYSVEVSSW